MWDLGVLLHPILLHYFYDILIDEVGYRFYKVKSSSLNIGMLKKIISNLTVRLFIGVVAGIILGLFLSENAIGIILAVKHVLGQLIFFMVPLIIIGFVAPSIIQLKNNASSMLSLALLLAYFSSVGSAGFAMLLGYVFLPGWYVHSGIEQTQSLPELLFQLDIPPVMPVMSALAFSLLIGISVIRTRSELFEKLLIDFQKIVLVTVNKVLLPVLPFFIATNFCVLSYEGVLTHHLPVFFKVIAIVLVSHVIWLGFLYLSAGIYAGKNPWSVLKHYGPTYMTALGTMSSAATLGVALKSAKKSSVLRSDITDFSIPLFANIHLCGSVLTEVFFVMAVSQIVYGSLPAVSSMVLFVLLLGIFAIGAPGVPGGTVMASLGLITSVLGFDETGTALMLTIFALQDSFGTACNITGDGALSLFLSAYANKEETTGLVASQISDP